MSYLQKRERQTSVNDGRLRYSTPDMELVDAGEFFMSKKASCLPVVQGNKLVGIITSVDFVKLSLHFLTRDGA